MTFVSLFVGVVVFSSGLPQTPPAVPAESGQLRWVRGTVTETSSISLTVQVRDKAVSLVLDSDSKVVPAFGGKAINGQLAIGEPVLVTYDEQSDDVFSGDVYIPGSHQRALEIRRLGP